VRDPRTTAIAFTALILAKHCAKKKALFVSVVLVRRARTQRFSCARSAHLSQCDTPNPAASPPPFANAFVWNPRFFAIVLLKHKIHCLARNSAYFPSYLIHPKD
jgi:hypothetical protein